MTGFWPPVGGDVYGIGSVALLIAYGLLPFGIRANWRVYRSHQGPDRGWAGTSYLAGLLPALVGAYFSATVLGACRHAAGAYKGAIGVLTLLLVVDVALIAGGLATAGLAYVTNGDDTAPALTSTRRYRRLRMTIVTAVIGLTVIRVLVALRG